MGPHPGLPLVPSPDPSPELATGELASAEPQIFETVYAQHFPFVWRVLRGLGVSESSVDDVSQEVFVIVYRKLGELREPKALKAWLFAIARRVAKDHRRSRKRRGALDELDAERHMSRDGSPEGHASNRQALMAIASYADSLDEDHRALFSLALVEGLPVTEVAELLGLNHNTTYSRVRALRAGLRAHLSLSEDES